MTLVLSIFSGLGLLDRAFEAERFCVVRGPDLIWGGDVRYFHPHPNVFDGVIGGDPCQSHSALSNLVRAKGLEPSFPDMTPEFQRVIEEARPRWFLRENVPQAPDLQLPSYGIHSFLLDNAWLSDGTGMGQEQQRKRRFWFGVYGSPSVGIDLRRFIDFAAFELPTAPAIYGDARRVPVAIAGSGKVKRTAVGSGHDTSPSGFPSARAKRESVTGRHHGAIGVTGGHRGQLGRYTIEQMLDLQGLPKDFLDHCPFTMEGKRKAIGNGVPQAMGRAVAKAVRCAMESGGSW